MAPKMGILLNMLHTALQTPCNNFSGSAPDQAKGISSQLKVPANEKWVLICGKSQRTCPNRAYARSTLTTFCKECMKTALNMLHTALQTPCINFSGSALAQTKGISSQLKVPANEKSVLICGKSQRTCPNRADTRSTLTPFCKQCMRTALNMLHTALQTPCNNFSGNAPAQTKGISSQLKVPANEKSFLILWKIGENLPKSSKRVANPYAIF